MKSVSTLIISILIGLIFTNCKQIKVNKNELVITIKNNRLDLNYEGENRLTGSFPSIQSTTTGNNVEKENDSLYKFFIGDHKSVSLSFQRTKQPNIVGIRIIPNGNYPQNATDFAGIFFEGFPAYKHGVAFWRYKPWNSWTKPMKVDTAGKLESWDVQFYLWQYSDGTYGAAIPLSGNGYRTTLGSENNHFGAKAVSYFSPAPAQTIPLMAIGFGKDPYLLTKQLYEEGLQLMGKSENLRKNKKYPEVFEYLGWCTWNASDMGKKLSDKFLLDGAKSFTDKNIPLGFLIIDDGWSSKDNNSLSEYKPTHDKFPNGFKKTIGLLKTNYGVHYVGAWHAFNCYWSGVNKNSELGNEYKKSLFKWIDKSPIGNDPGKDAYMISPFTNNLAKFYDKWHTYLKSEGIDFVKVDNQLVVERMTLHNYPIWNLAESMHKSLELSVEKHFNGAIINCMDMTNDAFYNFGTTAVARAVEDYFPYTKDETYFLQKGNAAAHVLSAIYNSLWFGQMVYPDFDMFESNNPNGTFHAMARAISGGPVYLTDIPGEQKPEVINPLIFDDGRIIRADNTLQPTEDCLFQVQDAKPFKAFNMDGKTGLLGIWNMADTDKVTGSFKPSDVYGLKGNKFLAYEYFSHEAKIMSSNDTEKIDLPRFGYRLYYLIPIENDFAAIGLTNKYNAPATIKSIDKTDSVVKISLRGSGTFSAWLKKSPKRVLVNEAETAFDFSNNLLKIKIGKQQPSGKIEITIIK